MVYAVVVGQGAAFICCDHLTCLPLAELKCTLHGIISSSIQREFIE